VQSSEDHDRGNQHELEQQQPSVARIDQEVPRQEVEASHHVDTGESQQPEGGPTPRTEPPSQLGYRPHPLFGTERPSVGHTYSHQEDRAPTRIVAPDTCAMRAIMMSTINSPPRLSSDQRSILDSHPMGRPKMRKPATSILHRCL